MVTTSPLQTTPGQSLPCSLLVVEEVSSILSSLHPLSLTLSVTAALGTGKTSFLRLLLDTSVVSSRTTKDQLASVAKFVQGSSGHTAHLRTASIDINIDLDGNVQHQSLGLSLIDTPSLDFKDEATADRFLSETIRHIDARFAEGIEDVSAYITLSDAYTFSFFSPGLESTDWRSLRPSVSNFSFYIPLIPLFPS